MGRRGGMLYQAYQAHCDMMGPLRALASGAICGNRRSPGGLHRHAGSAQSHRRLRADLARRPDPRASAVRHRHSYGRQSRGRGERGGRLHAIRHAAAFQQGHRHAAAARAAGGAVVRPFRDAPAQHRAHDAAGARRLHHRLAQRARRIAARRPVRLRRLRRSDHPLSRSHRTGRPRHRGVPAVRRRADRGGRDGGGGQSGAAAQHDADGRADRHPREPDQGQRAGAKQADGLVRAEPDRDRAGALSRAAAVVSIRASCSSLRS